MSVASAFRRHLAFVRDMQARIAEDHLPIIAAGVAFYGLLAVFPALGAMVAIYGLVLDPQQVSAQVAAMEGVLPPQAVQLLAGQLEDLARSDPDALGLGAAGALALALWSASAGIRTLMNALNVAYDEDERRGFFKRTALALLLTLAAIGGGIVSIAAVVVLPAVLDFLHLGPLLRDVVAYARWPIVAVMVWLGLLVLYRYGPYRPRARWSWRDAGAALAILLWLAGSLFFSWYVENLANYNKTYGSMGAGVILLMWFLLSGYAVLLGAELNAELEHGLQRNQAARADRPLETHKASSGPREEPAHMPGG